MARILLVRHGQASFGAADYDALSDTGLVQSRLLGRRLAEAARQPTLVLCGSMRRHAQTAEAALTAMDLDAAWETDAGWDEYDHAALLAAYRPEWADFARMAAVLMSEPDPHRAFQREFGKAVERWMCGRHDADYAESWPGFRARIDAALRRLADRLGRGDTAMVFTSGGPIAAVAQRLLQMPDEGTVRMAWTLVNGAITRLEASPRSLRLVALNDHAHLERDAALITYR